MSPTDFPLTAVSGEGHYYFHVISNEAGSDKLNNMPSVKGSKSWARRLHNLGSKPLSWGGSIHSVSGFSLVL